MTELAAASAQLRDILQIETEPVAVMLVTKEQAWEGYSTFERLSKHRYCQALMKARRGDSVSTGKRTTRCTFLPNWAKVIHRHA